MGRVRRLATALSLTLVVLAGCGGSGESGGGDEAEITALAQFVVTSQGARAYCAAALTADFVGAVFGDVDNCMNAGQHDTAANAPTGATVTAISIDGDTATAVVTEQGGAGNGAGGSWSFTRGEDGWQVAGWQTEYLRASFKAELGPAYVSDGADDVFADKTTRACVSGKFQALADAEFRATAFAILRESDAGSTALRNWYYDCVPGGAKGVTALRRIFEDGLRQAEIPAEVIECTVLKLRKAVSDAEIRAMGKSGAEAPPPGVQKRIERATVDCVDETQ